MRNHETRYLLDDIEDIVQHFSLEGNLSGYGKGFYCNILNTRVRNLLLELNVQTVDHTDADYLSEVQTFWSVAVYDLKQNKMLGYVAYGQNWGEAFDIQNELQLLNAHPFETSAFKENLMPVKEFKEWKSQMGFDKTGGRSPKKQEIEIEK